MRRTMFLSILVLMAIVLVGCSSGARQAPVENGPSQPAAAEAVESTPAEAATEYTEQNSGTEVNVSIGETGESMSMPESFPEEVLPLPDDANIVNVNDNKEAKSVGIIFKTSKNFDEAVAYCQEIMKEGTITVEDKKDDSYLLMGSKDKYSIMITVSKYNGDNISILINVTYR